MTDRDRQQFQVRPGQSLGDRLIWRYPLASAEGRTALAGLEPRESVTVGYYRQLTEPAGAWAFMPVTTDYAARSLAVYAVQRRICDDLAERIRRALQEEGS